MFDRGMEAISDIVDKGISQLYFADTFRTAAREYKVLLLIPHRDWRPLHASWWKKKEVCVIGADPDGNFYLCHCDGSVRYWDHASQTDEVLAPSVREFLSRLA